MSLESCRQSNTYSRTDGDLRGPCVSQLFAAPTFFDRGSSQPIIVLAFGQDEEISGPRGAASIAKFLENIYGHQGIAMIVDEGGMGLDTVYGNEFALPGVAEKGYIVSISFIHRFLTPHNTQNAIITVEMSGGQ